MADTFGERRFEIEDLAILLQRRYNTFREIDRLTDELAATMNRQDSVSSELVLKMRGEELEKCDVEWQDIHLLAEIGPEAAEAVARLVGTAPDTITPQNDMEQKIASIRLKTLELIASIQEKDKKISLYSAKAQSYYLGKN